MLCGESGAVIVESMSWSDPRCISACDWLLMYIPNSLNTHYSTTPMVKGLNAKSSKRYFSRPKTHSTVKSPWSYHGSGSSEPLVIQACATAAFCICWVY